jgi:excisionase family DNA binding protein
MTITPDVQAFVDEINTKTCSVYQACGRTGLSHMTIRRRIKQGRVRAVCLGGNWRIWTDDLTALEAPGRWPGR